jgi:hypothetical protein
VFASEAPRALLAGMGFFDRFSSKRPEQPASSPAQAPLTGEAASAATAAGSIKARLGAAREKLEAKDLPAALAIYEEVLATAGDRPDVLVTISGDLGVQGHVREIIQLIAPRYDAERHGPATGLNVLQAYLAVRNPEAAQHVLDVLFGLKRPELEDRLYGFSNAIAELLAQGAHGIDSMTTDGRPAGEIAKVAIISVSKPIWFYGLDALEAQILPRKGERLRRLAFAQLSVLGVKDGEAMMKSPEEELGRLSRALPMWFAETFYFSPHYAPIAALGVVQRATGGNHHMVFTAEWSLDNLRQLIDSSTGGLDYVFTGALKHHAGDYELVLRVWEVKKLRERKAFTARWTPASADAELAKLHEQVRLFMEWAPAKEGLPYAMPAHPWAWLETLGFSTGLFMVDKNLLPAEQLAPVPEAVLHASRHAGESEAASLAFLTLQARAAKLGAAIPAEVTLVPSELVTQASRLLA